MIWLLYRRCGWGLRVKFLLPRFNRWWNMWVCTHSLNFRKLQMKCSNENTVTSTASGHFDGILTIFLLSSGHEAISLCVWSNSYSWRLWCCLHGFSVIVIHAPFSWTTSVRSYHQNSWLVERGHVTLWRHHDFPIVSEQAACGIWLTAEPAACSA